MLILFWPLMSFSWMGLLCKIINGWINNQWTEWKESWHGITQTKSSIFFIQSLFAGIIQCMDVHAMKVRLLQNNYSSRNFPLAISELWERNKEIWIDELCQDGHTVKRLNSWKDLIECKVLGSMVFKVSVISCYL